MKATRKAATKGTGRMPRITPCLLESEHELIERAVEKLIRETGGFHTVSSVLRDGGLAYAQKILAGECQ